MIPGSQIKMASTNTINLENVNDDKYGTGLLDVGNRLRVYNRGVTVVDIGLPDDMACTRMGRVDPYNENIMVAQEDDLVVSSKLMNIGMENGKFFVSDFDFALKPDGTRYTLPKYTAHGEQIDPMVTTRIEVEPGVDLHMHVKIAHEDFIDIDFEWEKPTPPASPAEAQQTLRMDDIEDPQTLRMDDIEPPAPTGEEAEIIAAAAWAAARLADKPARDARKAAKKAKKAKKAAEAAEAAEAAVAEEAEERKRKRKAQEDEENVPLKTKAKKSRRAKQAIDSEADEQAVDEVVSKKTILDEVIRKKIPYTNVASKKEFKRKGKAKATPKALYWWFNPKVRKFLEELIQEQIKKDEKNGNILDAKGKGGFTKKVLLKYIKCLWTKFPALKKALKAAAGRLN